ncbi:PilZ domain-containing protein [Myxococcota bacterium]|nr:PilZ domain-containing protein [Myxococcota bacterium]
MDKIVNIESMREHRRFSWDIAGIVAVGDKRFKSTVRDISKGGVLLEIKEKLGVTRGTTIRLTILFTGGVQIELPGMIRWVKEDRGSRAPNQYGLQFYMLGQVEKEVIESYVAQYASGVSESPKPTITSKDNKRATQVLEYDFQDSVEGCAWLEIRGSVTAASARTLSAKISQWLGRLRGKQTILILDATHYQPSSEESLAILRRSFTEFSRVPFFGALVGPSSIGMLQIRRLVRDVGIADGLVSFETTQEAQEFLLETEEFGPVWRRFNRVAPK